MNASHLQPLSIDCSLDYNLDMSMFPGWNDPWVRAQPSVILHRQESCICHISPQITPVEEQKHPTASAEYFSFVEILDHTISDVNANKHRPDVDFGNASDATLEDVLSIDSSLVDHKSDPYIIGTMTPSPLSPVVILSSSPLQTLLDIDFLLLSPVETQLQLTTSRQKRKHGGDTALDVSSVAKRHCYYGKDLFSELDVTFNMTEANVTVNDQGTSDPVDEIEYDFIAPVRD
ncbi:uncharacterized protein LOC132564512 [Ylistrum balloti]|uniref:uncharacterized protein LOC132564512 n=1 Tax=Ylistrum balloti TaxID=509963 RepID=UPI0029059DE5|nr:uncharacterized protein LOC132564512 [Ylistrum balloti]